MTEKSGVDQSGVSPWNSKGMAVEFAEDVLRVNSWTLKGVGAHGSDLEVVSAEHYLELAVRAQHAQHAAAMWAENAQQAKGRLGRAREIGEGMCEALRFEANPLCDQWDDLMADEFMLAIKGDD